MGIQERELPRTKRHRKHRLKRLAASSLALVTSFALMTPGLAFAASQVSVDGTDYDSASSGEGWNWDGADDMALNGYKGGSISAVGDLNITLEGDNEVYVESNYGPSENPGAPAYATVEAEASDTQDGNLTIKGDGSLSVKTGMSEGSIYGTNVTITDGASVDANVSADERVTIENASTLNGVCEAPNVVVSDSTVNGWIGFDSNMDSRNSSTAIINSSTITGTILTANTYIFNSIVKAGENAATINAQDVLSIVSSDVSVSFISVVHGYMFADELLNETDADPAPKLYIYDSNVSSEKGIIVLYRCAVTSSDDYDAIMSALHEKNLPVIEVINSDVAGPAGVNSQLADGKMVFEGSSYAPSMTRAMYGFAYGTGSGTISEVNVRLDDDGFYSIFDGIAKNVKIQKAAPAANVASVSAASGTVQLFYTPVLASNAVTASTDRAVYSFTVEASADAQGPFEFDFKVGTANAGYKAIVYAQHDDGTVEQFDAVVDADGIVHVVTNKLSTYTVRVLDQKANAGEGTEAVKTQASVSPKTGDESMVLLFAGMTALSLCSLALLSVFVASSRTGKKSDLLDILF